MGMPMPQKMSVRDKIDAARAATQARVQAVRDARNAAKPATPMPDQTASMVSELPVDQIKKLATAPKVTGGGSQLAMSPTGPVKAPPLPDGAVYKKGGKVSASRRADGIAQRGKTRGKYI